MNLSPPSPEVLAQLRAQYSYRYPQTAGIKVTGDRGATVELSFVIGNPKGACILPPGEKSTTAWVDTVMAGLRPRGNVASQLAQDSLLYPELRTWGEWVARWPGLPDNLGTLILRKLTGPAVVQPGPGEEPPAALLPALDADPTAAWMRLKSADDEYAIVVKPPSEPVYRRYHEDVKQPPEQWKTMREMVAANVAACVHLPDGAERSIADLYTRWPVLGVYVLAEIERLAGGLVDAELGE
jgi:hypothetical protein